MLPELVTAGTGMSVVAAVPPAAAEPGIRSDFETSQPISPSWPRDVVPTPPVSVGYGYGHGYGSGPVVDYGAGPGVAGVPVAGVATGFRRQRGRTLLIGGLVIVLGVGGGIAYEVLKPAATTPASVVQQYFDDLGKGDTASALALVSGAGSGSGQASDSLLVPQALASVSERPTDVQVGSSTTVPGFSQVSLYVVHVTYKVGDTSMATDFQVVKAPAGTASPYLLQAPFFDLEVGDPGGRDVTINGVSVDLSQTTSFAVFPAVYTATAQGNALLAGDTQTGALGSDTTDTINFDAPQLASGAQDAIQSQVNQQIDTCAQSTDPYPTGCPFDLYSVYIDGSISSVQWSITTYPTVTVTPAAQISAGEQADFSDSADDGLAHYVVTYTDYFGSTQTTEGDLPFSVSGTAAMSGSGITVNFDSFG